MKKPIVFILALYISLIAACSTLDRVGEASKHLLTLRLSWQIPAEQAGVLEEMEHHVNRLDEAILSGDPRRVRNVLLTMEPIYMQLREEIQFPTPEQVMFDEHARALWEAIHAESGIDPRWIEGARLIIRLLV